MDIVAGNADGSATPGQLPAPPTARFAIRYIGWCMSSGVGASATSTPSMYHWIMSGFQFTPKVWKPSERSAVATAEPTAVWAPVDTLWTPTNAVVGSLPSTSNTSSSGGQE